MGSGNGEGGGEAEIRAQDKYRYRLCKEEDCTLSMSHGLRALVQLLKSYLYLLTLEILQALGSSYLL